MCEMTLQEEQSLQRSHCEIVVARVEATVGLLPATNSVERLNVGVGIASGREAHLTAQRVDGVWCF